MQLDNGTHVPSKRAVGKHYLSKITLVSDYTLFDAFPRFVVIGHQAIIQIWVSAPRLDIQALQPCCYPLTSSTRQLWSSIACLACNAQGNIMSSSSSTPRRNKYSPWRVNHWLLTYIRSIAFPVAAAEAALSLAISPTRSRASSARKHSKREQNYDEQRTMLFVLALS